MKPKTNNVDKFSVVIPTMWRVLDVFERALTNYIDHELVDEVVIIDNDKNAKPDWSILQHPKVRLMTMDQNIFVNPAWNLGVSSSKNDKLIIANDDIEFDIRLLDKIHPRITADNGVHGIISGEEKFMHPQSTDYSIDFKAWEPGDNTHCFGQLMFLHKDNWSPIDNRLKVYYGDDAIFHWHLFKGLTNYMIYNIKFHSPMAGTTRDGSITGGLLEQEFPIYTEWKSIHPLSSAINKNVVQLKKRILVAIPTAKYIEVETFKSLFDLTVPDGYELEFQYFYGYSISQIRNLIAEWAKRYDYLFSLDSDIILPKDTLTKMLQADKDIISGLYIQRIPNTHTLEVYMDTPSGGCTNIPYQLIKDRGVVEVAACGMGCALIKSEVFRKMPYPHFFYKEALNHADTVSEDVFFCMKARENGFKVWADASIECDHKGSTLFKVEIQNNELLI